MWNKTVKVQGLDLTYCCSLFLDMHCRYVTGIYLIVNCSQPISEIIYTFKERPKKCVTLCSFACKLVKTYYPRKSWTCFLLLVLKTISYSAPRQSLTFVHSAPWKKQTVTSLFTRRILEQTDGKITFFLQLSGLFK